jgi:hypothetical protein
MHQVVYCPVAGKTQWKLQLEARERSLKASGKVPGLPICAERDFEVTQPPKQSMVALHAAVFVF